VIVGVHAKVRERDLGLQALLTKLKATKSIHVKVGVVGNEAAQAHDGHLTNAQLAAIHEFGAPGANVPERSFIRSTVDAKRHEYTASLIPSLLKSVVSSRISVFQAFELFGQRLAADIRARITQGDGIPPPLAAATIAAKGSSRPLVDTGRLLAAITYKVFLGPRETP
jgi:hypothetical protein